ncbi:MAG: hypothetical protein LBS19_05225, partial [Clostridiales bacterium]|nr:hypothetical protein [Clostridiales bacterium]
MKKNNMMKRIIAFAAAFVIAMGAMGMLPVSASGIVPIDLIINGDGRVLTMEPGTEKDIPIMINNTSPHKMELITIVGGEKDGVIFFPTNNGTQYSGFLPRPDNQNYDIVVVHVDARQVSGQSVIKCELKAKYTINGQEYDTTGSITVNIIPEAGSSGQPPVVPPAPSSGILSISSTSATVQAGSLGEAEVVVSNPSGYIITDIALSGSGGGGVVANPITSVIPILRPGESEVVPIHLNAWNVATGGSGADCTSTATYQYSADGETNMQPGT